mmetsp:Transcript_8018/g.25525  ORF Transcript_8018/g.25525 Transcript_8018/m.25525 type:complete len:323 (+) Transcript_8018:956-1924(+)
MSPGCSSLSRTEPSDPMELLRAASASSASRSRHQHGGHNHIMGSLLGKQASLACRTRSGPPPSSSATRLSTQVRCHHRLQRVHHSPSQVVPVGLSHVWQWQRYASLSDAFLRSARRRRSSGRTSSSMMKATTSSPTFKEAAACRRAELTRRELMMRWTSTKTRPPAAPEGAPARSSPSQNPSTKSRNSEKFLNQFESTSSTASRSAELVRHHWKKVPQAPTVIQYMQARRLQHGCASPSCCPSSSTGPSSAASWSPISKLMGIRKSSSVHPPALHLLHSTKSPDTVVSSRTPSTVKNTVAPVEPHQSKAASSDMASKLIKVT